MTTSQGPSAASRVRDRARRLRDVPRPRNLILVGIIGKIPAALSLDVTTAPPVSGVVVSLLKTRKRRDTLRAS